MIYHIYALGEQFEKSNVYHQVEATSPKKAACVFALNEESLYGMCDQYYNVYDSTGNLITLIDVKEKHYYINLKSNEPEEQSIGPFSLITGESIKLCSDISREFIDAIS